MSAKDLGRSNHRQKPQAELQKIVGVDHAIAVVIETQIVTQECKPESEKVGRGHMRIAVRIAEEPMKLEREISPGRAVAIAVESLIDRVMNLRRQRRERVSAIIK